MQLPEGIETELIAYLHLELGEDADDERSIKQADLQYEGEFDILGLPTHFWRCGTQAELWATVEPYGHSYCIGMTSSSPNPIAKSDLYQTLHIGCGDKVFQIQLQMLGESHYGLSDYQALQIEDSEVIEILAGAEVNATPPSVVIGVRDGDQDCYIRASVGISMRYVTGKGTKLLLRLGPRI